jgi:hypothetical protein
LILKSYPDNRSLKDLFDRVLISLKKEKKENLLETRPTRYVIELNYSMTHMPIVIQNRAFSPAIKIDFSKIDYSAPLNYYQFGLYRKVNIKDKLKFVNGKRNFAYSQVGLKFGYMNMSSYKYLLNPSVDNTTFEFKQGKLYQIEASFIWRRFFMFNLGYLTETLPEVSIDNSILAKQNNYFCSTLGLRIPFRSIHFTTDVTGYKNSEVIKFYAKAGISLNFGLSKKYNSDDKKYIENEVLKLRDN